MIILADVVVAGLALATLIFLPLSLACSLTATSWLASAIRWRRPWSLVGGILLGVFIAASTAVCLFFMSVALSFALSRGTDNALFGPLLGLGAVSYAALHFLIFRLSRRRFTADGVSTDSPLDGHSASDRNAS